MDAVRRLAASGLRQFSDDKTSGSLNLSYITPHIIVMGLPASGLGFLNERHAEAGYRVYSFTRSAHYDDRAFASQAHYPFHDHQVPPLEVLGAFCRDAADFLGAGEARVVALHCKAGKGRSGLMACALLLSLVHYLPPEGVCASVEEALKLYAEKRTTDGRGVTIPSQMRWLHYFKQTECGLQPIPAASSHSLQAAGLTGVPLAARATSASGAFVLRLTSCRPAESPHQLASEAVLAELPLAVPEGEGNGSGEQQSWEAGKGSAKEAVRVEGSVRLEVLAARAGGGASGSPLFYAWLHTGFVQPGRLTLDQPQLDKLATRMGSGVALWLHWQ